MERKSRMAPRIRVPVPVSEIEGHLEEQMAFLRKSVAEYDRGDLTEYKRISATLRILLHDTSQSHSIIGQLGLASIPFSSAAVPLDDRNRGSQFSLAAVAGTKFLPVFDQPSPVRNLSFQDWWSEPVMRDGYGQTFTRKYIVLAVANQDGGSHVDPQIDEAYHRLKNESSLGFRTIDTTNGRPDTFEESDLRPVADVEKAYIRHIAWEAQTSVEAAWHRVKGKRACICGSGRKARYCHGKGVSVQPPAKPGFGEYSPNLGFALLAMTFTQS
jgi:hypothetical protein